ncbi:MAG TPA: large conductance mechanosensitive channel protein MscL [Thermoanaerobaculia bacterium]|nr:large conductance mechanosensitive channel protein MscL [Thermoanaerobaculia bacterium]
MGMVREFKEFLVKQNALALAVAVIIGAAIGKVVSSIVDDVINPIIGMALPGGSWREAKIVLSTSTDATGKLVENGITYGHLIGALVDFVIIAFVVFMIIKFAMPKPEAAPATKECPQCKTLIPASATRCNACTQPVA